MSFYLPDAADDRPVLTVLYRIQHQHGRRVRRKADSRLMRIIGALLFWIDFSAYTTYLFMLPVGLTLRGWLEARGYRQTVRWWVRISLDHVPARTLKRIERQLTGPSYLWALPFPGLVRRWLRRVHREAVREILDDEPKELTG